MADVTGRYSLEDTMLDLEPVRVGAMTLDGCFAYKPPRQPIGIPAQTPRDCTTWTDAVEGRLAALEGESLPARVARLEMALGMVINALYAVNRDAALAASRALEGIIPGLDGLVVRGELNVRPLLEGVETAAGAPPKLDLGTLTYEQRMAEVSERLERAEAGGE